MHTLDLELFKYMLEYTKMLLLEQYEKNMLTTIDKRLAAISRHPGLKIMKNGLDITRLIADDLHNIMKVIIFTLDDLYGNDSQYEINNTQLSNIYYKFNKMYLASHMEQLSEFICRGLQVFEFIVASRL